MWVHVTSLEALGRCTYNKQFPLPTWSLHMPCFLEHRHLLISKTMPNHTWPQNCCHSRNCATCFLIMFLWWWSLGNTHSYQLCRVSTREGKCRVSTREGKGSIKLKGHLHRIDTWHWIRKCVIILLVRALRTMWPWKHHNVGPLSRFHLGGKLGSLEGKPHPPRDVLSTYQVVMLLNCQAPPPPPL